MSVVVPVVRRVSGWVGLVLAVSLDAHAETTLTGPEVSNVSAQSINVLRTLTHDMQARFALDDTPLYANVSMRSAPANFLVNNGQVISGAALRRYGGSLGIGAGKPQSGLAAFAGFAYDRAGIVAEGAPDDLQGVEYEDYFSDYVGYAGLAFHGYALTAGLRMTSTWNNRDQYDQIVVPGYSTADQIPYRPGSPEMQVQSPFVRVDGERRFAALLSLTAPQNSLLELALAQTPKFGNPEEAQQQLAGIRAATGLATLAELLELREMGIPVLGYNRYSADVDYWGDRYEAYHRAIQAQVAPPDPGHRAVQEAVVGVDDLMGLGIKLRTVTQATPVVLFRAIDASASWHTELDVFSSFATAINLGARVGLYRRATQFAPSLEGFAALSLGRVQLTGAYAYNAPDAGTFFPIPDVHVVGVTLAYGPLAMTRPLVPVQEEGQP